jgi:hypothetical protein
MHAQARGPLVAAMIALKVSHHIARYLKQTRINSGLIKDGGYHARGILSTSLDVHSAVPLKS